MQIGCKRFGCQKAVEVCYWSCKYRRACKDWKGALEDRPGSAAIQTRLEEASAKSGRPFDLATLVLPSRPKGRRETLKKMNRRENQETPEAPAAPTNKENGSAKPAAARSKKRVRQPAPASDGSVYLLLEKTGKYRQISESDLLVEAGRMLKDPSVRLVKGQLLVPQITLRPAK
jgi:hypothetical protein